MNIRSILACAIATLSLVTGASQAQVLATTDFAPIGVGTGSFSSVGCLATNSPNPDGVCGILANTTANFTFHVAAALPAGQFALVTFAYGYGQSAVLNAPLSATFEAALQGPSGPLAGPMSSFTTTVFGDNPSAVTPLAGTQFSYHFGPVPNDTGDYTFVIKNTSDRNLRIDDLTITAVPEPSAYALALVALGLLGTAARRNKRSS